MENVAAMEINDSIHFIIMRRARGRAIKTGPREKHNN
jgi:hypothetical protein